LGWTKKRKASPRPPAKQAGDSAAAAGSGRLFGGFFISGALFIDEEEVSCVYQKTSGLPEDEDRVFSKDRVDEKQRSAADAEIPEDDRHDAFLLPLARNPLDQKPAGKDRLAGESQKEQGMGNQIMDRVAQGGMHKTIQKKSSR